MEHGLDFEAASCVKPARSTTMASRPRADIYLLELRGTSQETSVYTSFLNSFPCLHLILGTRRVGGPVGPQDEVIDRLRVKECESDAKLSLSFNLSTLSGQCSRLGTENQAFDQHLAGRRGIERNCRASQVLIVNACFLCSWP